MFIDAIVVKVRDDYVGNQPYNAAIGTDLDGHKDILGIWPDAGGGESAKFWQAVLTDLQNGGVADVFFLVCDGLNGLPDSVNEPPPRPFIGHFLLEVRGEQGRVNVDGYRPLGVSASA